MTRDTVCGRTVAIDDVYATVVHDGVLYCFCSRRCWLDFLEDPVRYHSSAAPSTG